MLIIEILMKEYQDYYFRKARAENYPARSIYKLLELDAKFKLLFRGMRVLDLGASPGSWTLGCSQKAGSDGFILACDLKPLTIALPANCRFVNQDASSERFGEMLSELPPFDLVISDMAPATTGNKFTDQCRSAELVATALDIAQKSLKPGGYFVAKIFMGPDVQELSARIRQVFDKAKTFKPKSSRAESFETFLIGCGLKA